MIDGLMYSRTLLPELMDQPGLDARLHAQALRGLARLHRLRRTTPLLWRFVRSFCSAERVTRVLDVACGGGTIACELQQQTARAGCRVEIVGCDISPTAVEFARQGASPAALQSQQLQFVVADVLAGELPGPFDVVICSLFLHHLTEPQIVQLLQKMRAVSTQAVVIDDLQRSRLGYWLTWAGTRLVSRSHIVHVDGPQSVDAALTATELQQLADRAGLTEARISTHWPQRMVLQWTAGPVESPPPTRGQRVGGGI